MVCGSTGWDVLGGLSLHHLRKHPRDDVRPNLVMLCGSGTTGCHGRCESHDPQTLAALAQHILDERPDVVAYQARKRKTSEEVVRDDLLTVIQAAG